MISNNHRTNGYLTLELLEKCKELGLKNKDFVGKVGSKGYVSSLLNKKKPLTLELARLFHQELNIPAEILLS